jgi:hypothetical protein
LTSWGWVAVLLVILWSYWKLLKRMFWPM